MYVTVLITKGTAMTKKHTVTITIAKYDLKQIIHNAIRDNLLKYNSKQTMQQLTVNKAQLQSNLRKLENSIIKDGTYFIKKLGNTMVSYLTQAYYTKKIKIN